MKLILFILGSAIASYGFVSSPNPNAILLENHTHKKIKHRKSIMQSYISIFEIPATDISRAIEFYQNILNVSIEKMEFDGMEMGLLPYEEQAVTGLITKGEGFKPSAEGITIYLNAGDDLQIVLDRVEKNQGKVIVPKTAHADESGFFAIFLDSEGNRLGLHSLN